MARKVDISELVDAVDIAEMLGAASHRTVAAWRTRHPTFPEPIIDMGRGRPRLWLRSEIKAWAAATGRSDVSRGRRH